MYSRHKGSERGLVQAHARSASARRLAGSTVTRSDRAMCRGCASPAPGAAQRRPPHRLVRNAPIVEAEVPNMNRSYTPLSVSVAVVFVNRVVEGAASTVSISVLVPAVTSVELEALPSAMALATGV